MKYYVYKITNTVNGHYYIGKRRNANPETDPYMGSGRLIKEAIAKYGGSSFSKEILSVFETDEEAAIFEASLVTPDTIKDPACYNMHRGGKGTFANIQNSLKVEAEG